MSKDYRGYLTQAGLNYESTAHALGKVVNIAKIGIGNGVLPDDQSPMGLTAMVNKIAEFPAKVYQDEKNPGVFVAECAIPAEHAINGTGYYINEMSAILDNGILYAYRRVSGDFKPLITSGEAKSYLYRLRFIPQNAGVVNVTIDPSVVWPTLADLKREIQRHEESRNHPDASLTEKGFVQLSSATDSTSETLAATPKAVKTVHDLAASKAPVNSPALTGHPTAPTPVDSAAGQEIATAAFVVAKIAKLVNSSPAALDTLQELAAALGNDPNFSATVMNLIGQKLSKDQNGADIPDKQRFINNLGLRDVVNQSIAGVTDYVNQQLVARDNNINSRATWDYVNQTFVRRLRRGAVAVGSNETEAPAGCFTTMVIRTQAWYRPLQMNINGGWYNVDG